jgi:hypothetical protein
VTTLAELLAKVPAVYDQLEGAMVPGGGAGDGMPTGPRSVHPNAPARLDVIDHRHQLLRGLRWWVDAVQDVTVAGKGRTLSESPARMCAVLLHHLPDMAAEDRATLRGNLWDWIGDAMPMVGKVEAPKVPALPLEALDRVVPVHVAAKALGVSVRTVRRRAPRTAGMVKLSDAAGPLCPQSDLPATWCDHCRAL